MAMIKQPPLNQTLLNQIPKRCQTFFEK